MQRIPKDSCTALNCPESQQIPLSHSCCKICKGKVIVGYISSVIYKLSPIVYIDFFLIA